MRGRIIFVTLLTSLPGHPSPQSAKVLVAHRGASAHAPEHTLEAYRLAIDQGADFVEQDLQVTRDRVLICLHDETLERTTNVEEVFPQRYRRLKRSLAAKRWYACDFTLEEIKRLDAGSWFDPRFTGARIPTWAEAITTIRGQAGLYPEIKSPDFYHDEGIDVEALVVAELRRHGLDRAGAEPRTPVVIQSFSAQSLRRIGGELALELPLVFLAGRSSRRQLSQAGLVGLGEFIQGIGPDKRLIRRQPEIVARAHRLGLTVTPYTFRSSRVGAGFDDVRAEMEYFLYTLNVDALFTDNPDQFPRKPPQGQ